MSDTPSQEEVGAAVNYIVGHLRNVMLSGRFSTGLALDLALPMLIGRINIFRVIDEISIMEGKSPRASNTKPATLFKGRLLKGYWHKHYTQADHMARNIQLEMRRDRTVDRVMSGHIGQEITPEIINKLVHAVVQENYSNRSRQGRLTGEWIVFQKTICGNVYLSLASHLEDDRLIAERLAAYRTFDLVAGSSADASIAS